MSNKCKASLEDGKKCQNCEVIGGYCLVHYRKVMGNIPKGCEDCFERRSCHFLKINNPLKCSKRCKGFLTTKEMNKINLEAKMSKKRVE